MSSLPKTPLELENEILRKEIQELKTKLDIPKVKVSSTTKLIAELGTSKWAQYNVNGKLVYKKMYSKLTDYAGVTDNERKLIESILGFQSRHLEFKMKIETIADFLGVNYPTAQRIINTLMERDLLIGNLNELGGYLQVNLLTLVAKIKGDTSEEEVIEEPKEVVTEIVAPAPEVEKPKRSTKPYSLEEYIRRANLVYGNHFDYSKVVYTNNKSNILIVCPEHGEFVQRPDNHLNGNGCRECNRAARQKELEAQIDNVKDLAIVKPVVVAVPKVEKERKSKVWTKEKFVEKAKEVHGDKYDYSLVEYSGSLTKIKVICPKHGEFEVYPNNHIRGSKCRKCATNAWVKDVWHIDRDAMAEQLELEYVDEPTQTEETEFTPEFNRFLKIITNLNK